MSDFGPVSFTDIIEVQAICVGPGGTTFSTSVFYTPGCDPLGPALAVTLSADTATVEVGTPVTWTVEITNTGPTAATGVTLTDLLGTTYSPAGPYTVNPGQTVTVTGTTTPTTVGTLSNTATVSGPVTSNTVNVTVFDGGTPNLLADQTIALADQGQGTVTFCAGCPATWEIRIDDPLDQFNSPDPDPGLPADSDAWQPVPSMAGQPCLVMAVDELWPDGQNPGPNETFFLHIRATCGPNVQTATLTINT